MAYQFNAHAPQEKTGKNLARKLALLTAFFAFVLTLTFYSLSQSTLAEATETTDYLYMIKDDATGGDCTNFGIWNSVTKTCSLTSNILTPTNTYGLATKNIIIEILSDNVILDGGGHEIYGNGRPNIGVHVSGRNHVAVRNLVLTQYNYGVLVESSSDIALTGNTTMSNVWSLKLQNSHDNNLADNNVETITLIDSDRNLIGNNATSLTVSIAGSYNQLSGNIISVNTTTNYNGINLGGTNNLVESNRIEKSPYDGIFLNGKNNTIRNNTIINNKNPLSGFGSGQQGVGIRIAQGSSYNMVLANDLNNNGYGIVMERSSNNMIKNNQIYQNGTGIFISQTNSTNNRIYHNIIQANLSYAAKNAAYEQYPGNQFNLSEPTGGNYWGTSYGWGYGGYWSCTDANHNGFCDQPFANNGIVDELPWASPNWPQEETGKPSLTVLSPVAYWSTYDDYLARKLSVDLTLRNKATAPAYNVKLLNIEPASGAQLIIPTQLILQPGSPPPSFWPKYYGDMKGGQSKTNTFKFQISSGLTRLNMKITAEVNDAAGTLYRYP